MLSLKRTLDQANGAVDVTCESRVHAGGISCEYNFFVHFFDIKDLKTIVAHLVSYLAMGGSLWTTQTDHSLTAKMTGTKFGLSLFPFSENKQMAVDQRTSGEISRSLWLLSRIGFQTRHV